MNGSWRSRGYYRAWATRGADAAPQSCALAMPDGLLCRARAAAESAAEASTNRRDQDPLIVDRAYRLDVTGVCRAPLVRRAVRAVWERRPGIAAAIRRLVGGLYHARMTEERRLVTVLFAEAVGSTGRAGCVRTARR